MPNPRHVREQAFCFLCRDALPLRRYSKRPNLRNDSTEEWATDVFGFFSSQAPSPDRECDDLGNIRGDCPTRAFRADLRDASWTKVGSITHFQLKNKIEFCSICAQGEECRRCRPDDAVDYAHAACVQLARARATAVVGDHDRDGGLLLQRIARYARPLLPWDHAVALAGLDRRDCHAFSPIGADLLSKTDLAQLLGRIESLLPLELRDLVYDNTSCLFNSLSSSSCTLSRYQTALLDHQSSRQGALAGPGPLSPHATYPLRDFSAMGRIGASFVRILDEVCLADIGIPSASESSESSTPFEQVIDIDGEEFRGFQYSIGAYGIVALRLLYSDGRSSQWLGEGPGRWTTTFEATNLRRVRAVSDGFKLIRLDEGEVSSSIATNPPQIFWDDETVLPRGARHSFVDLNFPGAKISGHPGARLMKHIHIPQVGLESLTMHFNQTGIVGVDVNDGAAPGRKRESDAQSDTVAVTHHFQPGEAIRSVHFVTRGHQRPVTGFGAYVLVKTTHGRAMFYGTHLTFFMPLVNVSSFKTEPTEIVTGLFYDPTSMRDSNIFTLGITVEARKPTCGSDELSRPASTEFAIPRIQSVQAASSLNHFPYHSFSNQANLVEIRTMALQRRGDRCIGLRIERWTGAVDILGQWDQRNRTAELLYDCQDGELESLTFAYSGVDPKRRYVTDVVANSQQLCPTKSFTCTELKKELVWWFSPTYDQVENWEGTISVVDMTAPKYTHEWV